MNLRQAFLESTSYILSWDDLGVTSIEEVASAAARMTPEAYRAGAIAYLSGELAREGDLSHVWRRTNARIVPDARGARAFSEVMLAALRSVSS